MERRVPDRPPNLARFRPRLQKPNITTTTTIRVIQILEFLEAWFSNSSWNFALFQSKLVLNSWCIGAGGRIAVPHSNEQNFHDILLWALLLSPLFWTQDTFKIISKWLALNIFCEYNCTFKDQVALKAHRSEVLNFYQFFNQLQQNCTAVMFDTLEEGQNLQPHYSNGVFSNILALDNIRRWTLPVPNWRNGSCRYVGALSLALAFWLTDVPKYVQSQRLS